MKFHTVIVQKDKVTTVRLVPSTCLSMKQKLHAGILTNQRATILANNVIARDTNDADIIKIQDLSIK